MIPDNVLQSMLATCVRARQKPEHAVVVQRDARTSDTIFDVTRRYRSGPRVFCAARITVSDSALEDASQLGLADMVMEHFDAALAQLDLAEAIERVSVRGAVRVDSDEGEARVERAALELMAAVERYRKGKR